MSFPFTPAAPDRASDALSVLLLGCVEWRAIRALQEQLAFEIAGRADRHGYLLLCEHPPGLTVGRSGSHAHLPDEGELESRNLDVRWVRRGGGVLVHTPGQLCCYAVVPAGGGPGELSPLGLRNGLAEGLRAACEDVRVPADLTPDGAAVQCRTGVVGQVGCAVRDGVSRWGAWLNVAPPMDLVRLAKPADGRRLSCLSAARHDAVAAPAVRTAVAARVAEALGYETHHTFTGHPLLRRARRPARVPA